MNMIEPISCTCTQTHTRIDKLNVAQTNNLSSRIARTLTAFVSWNDSITGCPVVITIRSPRFTNPAFINSRSAIIVASMAVCTTGTSIGNTLRVRFRRRHTAGSVVMAITGQDGEWREMPSAACPECVYLVGHVSA